MMTFKEFQATRSNGVDPSSNQTCFVYQDNLMIFTDYRERPYLEIANVSYEAPIEELELILYGWALEEGYFD